MRKLRIVIVALIILALAFTSVGCSLVSVDEDKDRKQVVATVDRTDITKGEVLDAVGTIATSYGYPVDYFYSEEMSEQLDTVIRQALDQLILDVILTNKADELGFSDFTEEEEAGFVTQANEYLTVVREQLEFQIVQENEAMGLSPDEDEVNNEIQRRLDELLVGYGSTEEDFYKLFKKEETFARVQEHAFKDIDISEEEVRSFYDTSLEGQESMLTESPEFYDTLIQVGTFMVFEPLETKYVRHILVPIEDEDQALSSEAQASDYAATTDEEKAAAMAILDPAFKKIMPIIEEIQQKIADGEDFDALIIAHGKDPGMESNPEGYAVKEGEGIYVENFEKAAIALENVGDISEPVKTFFGYHILKLLKIDPAGAIPYEDIQEDIKQNLLNEAQAFAWSEATEEWKNEAEIVEDEKKLN